MLLHYPKKTVLTLLHPSRTPVKLDLTTNCLDDAPNCLPPLHPRAFIAFPLLDMLGLTAGQNSSVMWGNDKAKTLDAGEMMLQHHIQHQFCEFDRWPQAPHSPYKACARSNRKDVAETVAVLNIPNQEINVTNVKLGEGSTSE
eukprot:3135347-Rhodomonas_salina.1